MPISDKSIVFPGFFTPVMKQLLCFQSHRILSSHASEVQGGYEEDKVLIQYNVVWSISTVTETAAEIKTKPITR